MDKKWYKSKTLWVNGIMMAGVVLNSQFGIELTAEEQGAILVFVNLVLRIITKGPLTK
jgi:putative effector of murein hydrolase LrgA (UPF0299 family)